MPRPLVIAIASGLVLAAALVFAALRTQNHSPPLELESDEEALPVETRPSRAEQVIKALAAAYPRRIERAEFRDDDWALLMDGVWYYYAGGRMLPEELLEQADDYSGSFIIYNYQSELPPWTEPDPEQAARYRNRGANDNNNARNNNSDESGAPRIQRSRSNHFFEALWQAGSRDESSRRVNTIEFLNFSLVVHSGIAEVLTKIEERILAAAETDPELRSWVNGIGEMHGWGWRNIQNSQSRSYHSYGIAVDILPKSMNGKEMYWLWAAQKGREWWNIPYEDRCHPPDTVIKIFESYGFVWGGKWVVFDTMHFEYRPEVFVINGLDITTLP